MTTHSPRPGGHASKSAPHARRHWFPLLQKRGLELIEHPAGNFELRAYKGLLVKDGYWRWPERGLAGNAIDFFVRVLGMSFHDATRQITGT